MTATIQNTLRHLEKLRDMERRDEICAELLRLSMPAEFLRPPAS
jgi:hypothetical protein